MIITAGVLAATTALTSCGSGSSPGSGSSSTSKETEAPLALTSPALARGHTIPARYTCDASNVSLPLRWTGVPSGTAELVVYALEVVHRPGQKRSGRVKAVVQWVVAGLSPALPGIAAGKLPRGAIVGSNSVEHKSIYSICPAKGRTQEYVFAVFALPHRLVVKPGFKGGRLFRQINNSATARATIIADYKRA